MKIYVLTVGKAKDKAALELWGRYSGRFGKSVKVELLCAEAAGGRLAADEARRREGRSILGKAPAGAMLVSLSEGGEEFDSRGFASWIEKAASSGRDLCFVIGGQEGLSAEVLRASDRVVSLSRLTFPHELCLPILGEQLYRAFSILRGDPYHRG